MSSSGTNPRSRTGAPVAAMRRSRRRRSRPAPAMATVRSGWSGSEQGGGGDQDVESLPGHQPAHADDHLAVGRQAGVDAGLPPLLGAQRPEPVDVDPGGTTVTGNPSPARWKASAAG